MAFTLYRVDAVYTQPVGNCLGFGVVCDSRAEAEDEALRMMCNLKVDAVKITPKRFGY